MIMHGEREVVTIQQAMARVDVSRRTIYNWINKGLVEYVRSPGGRIHIFMDTLFRRAKR